MPVRRWDVRSMAGRPNHAASKLLRASVSAPLRSPSQIELTMAFSPAISENIFSRAASQASPKADMQAPGPVPAIAAMAQRPRSPLTLS